MFSVNRPSGAVVLTCWVTETQLTPCFAKVSMMRAKSSKDRLA
jgi:hypothetical protein